MSQLDIFLLGSPRFERDGVAVKADTRKALAILAYVAITNEEHRREELAAMLWPEFDESRARAALRRTLSALKKGVGPDILTVNRDSVGLAPGQTCLDVEEFTRLASGADIDSLKEAVALYRDDFLTGFTLRDAPPFDQWQYYQGETYRDLLLQSIEKLVGLYVNRGELEPAVSLAQRWLEVDPLREEAHRTLMRLYAWTGRRSAALNQYRDCLRILESELGVPPLAETEALHQLIKRDQLALPQYAVPPEKPVEVAKQHAERAVKLPAGMLPLAGRSAELSALQEHYNAVGPNGRLLIVEGEAGVGKTRLVQEFLANRSGQGARVISTRCYEGEQGLAYTSLIEALEAGAALPGSGTRIRSVTPHHQAAVLRLVPQLAQLVGAELDHPETVPLEGPAGRRMLLSAITEVIAAFCSGAEPGILLVDDLQWADSVTLDWFSFLVRRMRERPLMVVATVRRGEASSVERVRSLLLESERAGSGASLALGRLPKDAVFELVSASVVSGAREVAHRLFEETEGLPFFVVEYLAAMAMGSDDAPGEPTAGIPRGVRELLHSRIAGSSETALQLLQTAAAIGRAFDHELIHLASGRSEDEIVLGLEEALGLDLIRERDGSGPTLLYDFNHALLRAVVYDEMSLARRRLLHSRLADALRAKAGRTAEPAAVAGQIGGHYQLAGREEEAADFMYAAAEHARSLFANEEALSYFLTALALGHGEAARIHEVCGDLHTQLGGYAAAINNYESAASLMEDERLAEIEHKIGQVYYRRGEYDLAQQQFEMVAQRLHPDMDVKWRASLYADWAYLAYRQGLLEDAQRNAELALQLAEATSAEGALSQAHNILGMLSRKRDPAVAVIYLSKSLVYAESSGQLDAQVAALNNLALAEKASGDLESARRRLQEALQLCRTYGDRHREAALLNNLADIHHEAGRPETSIQHFTEAVSILAEIDPETTAWQPEIWKLTEW